MREHRPIDLVNLHRKQWRERKREREAPSLSLLPLRRWPFGISDKEETLSDSRPAPSFSNDNGQVENSALTPSLTWTDGHEHFRYAEPRQRQVAFPNEMNCAVLTVSDSRRLFLHINDREIIFCSIPDHPCLSVSLISTRRFMMRRRGGGRSRIRKKTIFMMRRIDFAKVNRISNRSWNSCTVDARRNKRRMRFISNVNVSDEVACRADDNVALSLLRQQRGSAICRCFCRSQRHVDTRNIDRGGRGEFT